MIDGGTLDDLLGDILKASGSNLRHYTLPKTLGDIRAAVRAVYDRGYADGITALDDNVSSIPPEEQEALAEMGRQAFRRAQHIAIVRKCLETAPDKIQFTFARDELIALVGKP